MPPIILSVTNAYADGLDPLVRKAIEDGEAFKGWAEIYKFVRQAADEGELLILDGLQRSLTILGIENSSGDELSSGQRDDFHSHKIRVEFYVGLSKTGILYRMLTLNTGQTPMSFRHQLEILYYDYIDNQNLPNGITVVREWTKNGQEV
jgi:hypothetical protein